MGPALTWPVHPRLDWQGSRGPGECFLQLRSHSPTRPPLHSCPAGYTHLPPLGICLLERVTAGQGRLGG